MTDPSGATGATGATDPAAALTDQQQIDADVAALGQAADGIEARIAALEAGQSGHAAHLDALNSIVARLVAAAATSGAMPGQAAQPGDTTGTTRPVNSTTTLTREVPQSDGSSQTVSVELPTNHAGDPVAVV